MTLPPGFRFHPTDEELVEYYLTRRVKGKAIEFDVVADVDLYKCEPWDLPSKSRLPDGDSEWFFFSPRDRKYPNGSRTNRATEKGYWKATGRDRHVKRGGDVIGMKKTLVFYTGRAPHGTRTHWLMHEYRLDGEQWEETNVSQDGFVLCRVFRKSALDLSVDPSQLLQKKAVVPDVEKNPVFSEIEVKPAVILQGRTPAPAPQLTSRTQLSTSRTAGRADGTDSGGQHDDGKSGEAVSGNVLSFLNEEVVDVADLHKIGTTFMDDSWMKFIDDEDAFLGVVPPVSNRTSDAKNEFSRTWMQENGGGENFGMDNSWNVLKVEDCITDLLNMDSNDNFISLEMMPPLEAAPESPGPLALTPETVGFINRRQRLSSPAASLPSLGGTAKRRVLFQMNPRAGGSRRDTLQEDLVDTDKETAAHLEQDAVTKVIEEAHGEQKSDKKNSMSIRTAAALSNKRRIPSAKSLIESITAEDGGRSIILSPPPDDVSVDSNPICTLWNSITSSTMPTPHQAGNSVSSPLVVGVKSATLSVSSNQDEPGNCGKEIAPDLEVLKAPWSEVHDQSSISVVSAASFTMAEQNVQDLVSQKSGVMALFYQPTSSIESPASICNDSKLRTSQFSSSIVAFYASFVSVMPFIKVDGQSKGQAGVRSRDRRSACNVPCAQILPGLWRALAADPFSKQGANTGIAADEDARKRPQVVFEWDLPTFSIRFFTELFRQVVATGVQIMTEVGGL